MALSKSTATRYFHALESAVRSFNRRWTKDVIDIGMYEMPIYPRDKQRDIVPTTIEPTLVTGRKAVALARKGISAFRRHANQHPSSVIRYPGWISVKPSLIRDIHVINELKTELQAVLKELEPVEAHRVALTRELFPGMAMLQVYRHIFAHEEPVHRLEFTWSPATRSTRIIDPAGAIRKLEVSLKYPPPSDFRNVKTWQSVVAKEIRDIESVKEGRLVIKKPVAPHPKVIVYFSGERELGQPRHDKIHPASMPLFIHAPDGLSVAPLKVFHFDKNRAPRRAVKPIRWISEPMGIGVVG